MLNSFVLRAGAIVSTSAVLFTAATATAGWLDRLKPRRTATEKKAVIRQVSVTGRAQSPDYSAGAWQQPAGTPWYDAGQSGSGSVYCCGPEDKHASWRERCHRKCDCTFYCWVPPYCFPCYGHNPTCWRRMQECYICPREAMPTPAPAAPRTAPATGSPPPVGPAVPPDPLPEEGALRRGLSSPRAATVSAPRSPAPPSRPSWTSYADAVAEEDEIPLAPSETLEEQLAAEGEELDDASVIPEMESDIEPPAGEGDELIDGEETEPIETEAAAETDEPMDG